VLGLVADGIGEYLVLLENVKKYAGNWCPYFSSLHGEQLVSAAVNIRALGGADKNLKFLARM
jgi:hypothetical protein